MGICCGVERTKLKPVHKDIFKYSSVPPKFEQNRLMIKFKFSLDSISLKFFQYLFGQKKLSRVVISFFWRLRLYIFKHLIIKLQLTFWF